MKEEGNAEYLYPINRLGVLGKYPKDHDWYVIKLKKIDDQFYCELEELKKLLNETKFL